MLWNFVFWTLGRVSATMLCNIVVELLAFYIMNRLSILQYVFLLIMLLATLYCVGLKCLLQCIMWRYSGIFRLFGYVYILYFDNIHILAKILMKKCMTKLMKMLAIIIEIKNLAKNFDGNLFCIIVCHDDVKIINIKLLLLKIHLSNFCLLEIYV